MTTQKKRTTVYLGAEDREKLEFLMKKMDAEDITETVRRMIRKEYREEIEDTKELNPS